MPRRYNSTRREESAARTRQDIIVAAIQMHGRGVTDFRAVAKAAGVAVPTVCKHFPSKEDLYRACTTHMRATLQPPSIGSFAAIPDPTQRLSETVRQVYQLHEARLGQSWNAYCHQTESTALAQALAGIHGFVGQIVDMLLRTTAGAMNARERVAAGGFARGLLSPLGYRSLRVIGGLDPDVAAHQTIATLACMLRIEMSATQ